MIKVSGGYFFPVIFIGLGSFWVPLSGFPDRRWLSVRWEFVRLVACCGGGSNSLMILPSPSPLCQEYFITQQNQKSQKCIQDP